MSEGTTVNQKERLTKELTKEKVFTEQFVKYHGSFNALHYTMDMEPWHMILMLRSDFDYVPVGQIYDMADKFLVAAYHLGEISGLAGALGVLYDMGLLNDYLDNPETVKRLQKLAFELYWLELQLEKPGLRGTRHLTTKTAKINGKLFKFMVRALKAAKAGRC